MLKSRRREGELLFPSKQKNSQEIKSHITRVQAYRHFKKVVKMNIENFAMRSLRKSFGDFYYQEAKYIARCSISSQEVTKRYIGLTKEEVDESLENVFL